MTKQPVQKKTLTLTHALMVLAVLFLLMELSFWSDEKSFEVEGPARIVKGPQDTLSIQIDRKIAKVSKDGEVLQVLDLDTDASIPEEIADYFVEDDGRLLIARRDSQILQYYSPEGKLLKTHERVPSALVGENHYCKFTKDRATGTLYFADTSHHRIQIYGSDEKERKTIVVPAGESTRIGQSEPKNDLRVRPAEKPLFYPNGMSFDGDRLFAADTGNFRILIFYPDGTLDRIIPVLQDESETLLNPFRVARTGDTVYAIVRGQDFKGARVAAYDVTTSRERPFLRARESFDPWDVFGRSEDVLVADRASLSVLRYTPEGKFLGTFGKSSLQSMYADRQVAKKTYQWVRTGSLAGMVLVLIWLIFASRRQRVSYEQAGQHLHTPPAGLQKFLGPWGSVRRNVLLVLVPGLGQAAAGRIARACTVFVLTVYVVSLVIYSLFQYRDGGAVTAPVLITVMLMTGAVWMFVALDGVRLSGKPSDGARTIGYKHVLMAFSFSFITIGAGIAAQLLREAVVQNKPELSLAVQALFSLLMSDFSGGGSSFDAVFPASVLFGWGGASAGMFAALSWQTQGGRGKTALALVAGFSAGITAWLGTSLLVGNRLGALLYMPVVQGITLSIFIYLFFRRSGIPLLIIPVAAAGAWIGGFLKVIAGGIGGGHLILFPLHWMGVITRIEFIAIIAFFIHLAIWVAWNVAATKPFNNAGVLDAREELR